MQQSAPFSKKIRNDDSQSHGEHVSSALKIIRQVTEIFFQYTQLNDMIRQTLHAALEVIGADVGSVLLADAESKQLIFHYVVGETAETLQGTGIPWDRGIAGAVWAAAKWDIVMAQAVAAARSRKYCVIVLSPVLMAFQTDSAQCAVGRCGPR